MHSNKSSITSRLALLMAPLLLVGCGEAPMESPTMESPANNDTVTTPTSSVPVDAPRAPNFIVMLGDDMGVETLASYGIGESPALVRIIDPE